VIATAIGVFYIFWIMGSIPIKIVALLGAGAIGTIYKMIRSLFLKVHFEDPGRLLKYDEAPALWNLTREVASVLHTRPVDEIRVTPNTELAVYERGTWKEKIQNNAHRILILGLAVVNDFKQNEFRAVLAHEYGHFSHRDTAGGEIALRVRADMTKFFYSLAAAGQVTWWNVAFRFLQLYNLIFRRISHGATRLQEVLADRVAAQTYGTTAFTNGLTHVIRRDIEFNDLVRDEIDDAIKSNRPVQNLYQLVAHSEELIELKVKKSLNRKTTEDDTHPSPVDRFSYVAAVAGSTPEGNTEPVWDLFDNRTVLTQEMTSLVEKSVKSRPQQETT